ncbi:lipopolysaccharide biosynthesis protein [Neptuniibacter sp. 2_MG-2023]|uniref:lipopolysaccharide biosynthesis protein n=1 Tax=Neptuniibacter sp. 2_MG-2023 TaxID=3062671 RepID=UPI0026E41077|nr:lipopolysaccharide biosynthesis protein [Neptuniibacter sp. 2_MG-2023]MDO6512887.1 lipopolysaccharide biosynthesis protein [Neptuniibacter sp. 2_MG-2023]
MSGVSSIRSNIIWSFVRNFGIRFGSMVVFFVLARILDPSELGLFATVLAILAFFEIIADGGVSDAIVQKKNVSNKDFVTGFYINVSLGFILSVVIVVFSVEISSLLNVLGITDLLRVAAIGLLLNSLSFVPQAFYRRKYDFKWLAYRALIGATLSGAAGITLALLGAGPWSLVAQFLTLAFLNALLVWWKKPFVLNNLFDCTIAVGLIKFGVAISLSKILYYVTIRGIELVIVASFGPAAIAVYVMGNRVVAVLQQLISAVTVDVYLPRFSRLVENKSKLFEVFYTAVEITSAISFPLFVGVAILSEDIVFILFGDNGQGAGGILKVLALLGSIQSVAFYCGSLLNSQGRPYYSLAFQMVRVLLFVFIFYVFSNQTLLALVNAYAFVFLCTIPVFFVFTAKVVGFSLWVVFNKVYPYLFGSSLMYLFSYCLEYFSFFDGFSFFGEFFVSFCFLFVFYNLFLFFFFKKNYFFVIGNVFNRF